MKVRRYVVDNMSEALSQIRIELGKDAIILSQRKVRDKGIKGLFSKKKIEVTAAIENSKKSETFPQRNENLSSGNREFNESVLAMTEALKLHTSKEDKEATKSQELSITEQYREKVKAKMSTESKVSENNDDILKELNELKSMINGIKGDSITQTHNELFELLEELDIEKTYFNQFKESLSSENDIEGYKREIKSILEKELEFKKFPEKGRIVLAGPTGVGKTTTIAKLAGKYALKGNKKVGLITIDTYRIGAVEQLKTYAEIMNIPIKVVFNTKEMDQALEELSYCDVVLVDTTGRSSKNSMQVSELRSYIDRVETENIFLVVSATTKNKDLKTIINGFKEVNYNGVVITKLDETSAYGMIYNSYRQAQKPISLIAVGQNVPDDIKDAKVEVLSNLIIGEESV